MTPGARAGVQSAQGLLLGLRNVGERDRVLDVLLRGRGRTSMWSQRARGSAKKQDAQALAPFVSAQFSFRPRHEGVTLVAQDHVQARLGLRTSLAALGRAGQLVALTQALFLTNEPADHALDTLLVALDHASDHRTARAAGAYPRLLHAAGVMPPLTHCNRCKHAFSHKRLPGIDGAELCCLSCQPLASALDEEMMHALAGARIESQALARRVEEIIVRWAGLHAGRSLVVEPWRL